MLIDIGVASHLTSICCLGDVGSHRMPGADKSNVVGHFGYMHLVESRMWKSVFAHMRRCTSMCVCVCVCVCVRVCVRRESAELSDKSVLHSSKIHLSVIDCKDI